MVISGMESTIPPLWTETTTYEAGPTLLTEEELVKQWRLTTDREVKVFKRMLNRKLPKSVCPQYIHEKDFFRIGGVYKFWYHPEKGRPRIMSK